MDEGPPCSKSPAQPELLPGDLLGQTAFSYSQGRVMLQEEDAASAYRVVLISRSAGPQTAAP